MYRKRRKHYIQINLNNVNTNKKPYQTFSLRSNEDKEYVFTDMIKIININVSYYRDLCCTRRIENLSDEEIAIGIIGIYQEEVLDKVVKRNEILKGIGEIVKKFSWVDDVVVPYDREARLRNALLINYDEKLEKEVEKEVKKAEERITKNVTNKVTKEVTKVVTNKVKKEVTEAKSKEIAKKLKDLNTPISDIALATGLSVEEIEQL